MQRISGTIQFVSLATGKTFIVTTASPREHTFQTNLNNNHINSFYSFSPFEQLANILSQ